MYMLPTLTVLVLGTVGLVVSRVAAESASMMPYTRGGIAGDVGDVLGFHGGAADDASRGVSGFDDTSWLGLGGEAGGLPTPGNVSANCIARGDKKTTSRSAALLPFFGQILAHDMVLTGNNQSREVPLVMRLGNGERVFPFHRSNVAMNAAGKARPINKHSSFIDAEQIYGNNDTEPLRARGPGGLISMQLTGDSPGHYMPPRIGNVFAFGDARENVAPGTVCLNIALSREHNRRALELAALHPSWTDDELFDRARRWVVGLIQHFTVREYIPGLLGVTLPEYSGYDPSANPAVDVFFSTASFRYGHSAVMSVVVPRDENYAPHPDLQAFPMRTSYFAPSYFVDQIDGDPVAPILRGLATAASSNVNNELIDSLRDGGIMHSNFDLAATNILRGRDVHLPTYNEARVGFGLAAASSFVDVTGEPAGSSPLADALASTYAGNISLLDSWVGLISEPHAPGAAVGALVRASLLDQFVRTRDGDEWWYEGDLLLSAEELAAVQATSLADVVARNTDRGSWPSALLQNTPIDGFGLNGVSGASSGAPSEYEQSVAVLDGFEFSWLLEQESSLHPSGVLNIAMTLNHPEAMWAGFGVGRDMVNADLLVVYERPDGSAHGVDKFTTFFKPFEDGEMGGQNDIIPESVEIRREGSTVIFKAARPLAASDSEVDRAISLDSHSYIFAWGADTDPKPAYHGPTNRGKATINVVSGEASCVPKSSLGNVYVGHGLIMLLSWGICAPIGLIIARYYRHVEGWLGWHETLQKMGTSGALPLALVAFLGKSHHFNHEHSIIGLLTIFIAVLQVLIGILTRRSLNQDSVGRLLVWSRFFHQWVGRALVVSGATNCYFGIGRLLPASDAQPMQTVYLVYLGCLVAVIVYCETRKRFPFQMGKLEWEFTARVTCRGRLLALFPCTSRYASQYRGGAVVALDSALSGLPVFTWEQVNDKVLSGQQWVVLAGLVITVRSWMTSHPGGTAVLKSALGTDVTSSFLGETVEQDDTFGDDTDGPAFGIEGLRKRNGAQIERSTEDPVRTTSFSSRKTFRKSQRQVRRRTHLHSAAAWSKVSDYVVGVIGEQDTDGSKRRHNMSQKHLKLYDDTIARALAHHGALGRFGAMPDKSKGPTSLVGAARAAQLALAQYSQTQKSFTAMSATRAHVLTLVKRCELTSSFIAPGKGPGTESATPNPVLQFVLALPSNVTTSNCLPGQHYLLSLTDGASEQVIERSYTPMIETKAKPRSDGVTVEGKAVPRASSTAAETEMPRASTFGSLHSMLNGSGRPAEEFGDMSEQDRIEFMIKIYPHGQMTSQLQALPMGSPVRVRGPLGTPIVCPACPSGRWTHVGMIAAGVGITPMLQMIVHQLGSGDRYPCSLSLLCVNRSEADVLLYQELTAIADSSHGRLKVAFTLTRPQNADSWPGRVGRPTPAMLREMIPRITRATGSAGDEGIDEPEVTDVDTVVPRSARRSEDTLTQAERIMLDSDATAGGDGTPTIEDGALLPAPTVSNARVLVCGPPRMVTQTAKMLQELGCPEEAIVELE